MENVLHALKRWTTNLKPFPHLANVQVLLPAACLLQMTEIQDACCEFLKMQLDPSNCLGIRAFADKHFCDELQQYADKFVQDNFQKVIESEEFLLLPVEQLIGIISNDELNVSSEEQAYNALRDWINYDVADRRKHLADVLEHVRLPQLHPKFLVETVGADRMIKADETCRDLVDEAKNYLLLPHERTYRTGPRFRPRKRVWRGEVLFAIGGWCSGDAIHTVECYDPHKNEWRMVASMSKRRCGVGVAVMDNFLYAVGGHDGQLIVSFKLLNLLFTFPCFFILRCFSFFTLRPIISKHNRTLRSTHKSMDE